MSNGGRFSPTRRPRSKGNQLVTAFARGAVVAGLRTRPDALGLLAGLGREPRPRRARTLTRAYWEHGLRAAERSAPFVAFPAVVADITGDPAVSVPL